MRISVATAGERGGDALNDFKDVRTEHDSNQGQNMALAGLCVPSLLDSGFEDLGSKDTWALLLCV